MQCEPQAVQHSPLAADIIQQPSSLCACMPCVCKKHWTPDCKAVSYMTRQARQSIGNAKHTAVMCYLIQAAVRPEHACGLSARTVVWHACLSVLSAAVSAAHAELPSQPAACAPALYTADLFTKSPAVSVLHTCTMACKSPQRAVGHRNFPLNASYTQECLLDVSNMS